MSNPQELQPQTDHALELHQAIDSGSLYEVRQMIKTLPTAGIAHLLESSPPKTRGVLWQLIDKDAEGEVLQLINKHNPASTEQSYMQVIHNKTAILFEAAAHCGAILANADAATQDALRLFGLHIGTAFQLIDDALDYDGDAVSLGKNVGDDLAEGKPTLPLIHAMTQCSESETKLIRECLSNKTPLLPDTLAQVISIIRESGSLEYTRAKAQEQATLALSKLSLLPPSVYRDALHTLAEFSVARNV